MGAVIELIIVIQIRKAPEGSKRKKSLAGGGRASIKVFQMMCQLKILHTNLNGYVARCRECNNIQVAYGTCILTISESEFQEFLAQVAEVVREKAAIEDLQKKQFTYSTDSRKVSMIFSFYDLEKLYHLMTPARLMVSIGELSSN